MNEVGGVTGLVLAGGRSQRFGADKARHMVGERSMLARVVAAVSAVCETVLVGTGKETSPFDVLDVHYVRDNHEGGGPLAGIHAALEVARTPWLLVVACDMPFVTAEALRELLAARSPLIQAVIAANADGRLQPLCACYRREILKLADEQLVSGRRAVHALVDRLDLTAIVPLPDRVLRNVNTMDDLADLS